MFFVCVVEKNSFTRGVVFLHCFCKYTLWNVFRLHRALKKSFFFRSDLRADCCLCLLVVGGGAGGDGAGVAAAVGPGEMRRKRET